MPPKIFETFYNSTSQTATKLQLFYYLIRIPCILLNFNVCNLH